MKTKKVIITVGIWGIGKTHYAKKFLMKNPEYTLLHANIENNIEKIKEHEFVIMDYYFKFDYNAEKLKKELNCPVEIIVLFDKPENISYRQIYFKGNKWIDVCKQNIDLYSYGTKELINIDECKFYDITSKEFMNYEEFTKKFKEYQTYSKEQVEQFLETIKKKEGYDYNYQDIDLPYGLKLGQGTAQNKETWELIEKWIDWDKKTVLEFGCNHGFFSRMISLLGGFPTGIDQHNDALYSACVINYMKGTPFTLMNGDLNEKLLETKFDVCLVMNVLHHINNPMKFLKKIKNICNFAVFEIKHADRYYVLSYFELIKEITSPKRDRKILLTKPKK